VPPACIAQCGAGTGRAPAGPAGACPAAAARFAVRRGSGEAGGLPATVTAVARRREAPAGIVSVDALSGLVEGRHLAGVSGARVALPGWLVTKLVTIRSELS